MFRFEKLNPSKVTSAVNNKFFFTIFRLKIYYSTQVSVAPPTFVIKVNDETLMHFSYRRYLENALRKAFDFSSTPVRIYVRNRNEKDDE